jgi:ribose transport system ATP-binding protein
MFEAATKPAASIRGVDKSFAGVQALHDVTFDIHRGAITALLGMNGSGKSTLIKILAGVYSPDPGGEILIGDQAVDLPLTPASAHRHGLRFLHQDVGLVDALTVADNFAFVDRFRGHGLLAPIDKRAQRGHVARTLARFHVGVSPDALVSGLTPTQRTMVGVARALQDDDADESVSDQNKILILDEPTAALPPEEVDVVLTALEDLRARGGTIIYVSHRTDEVARIADRIGVLRDGRLIVDEPAAGMRAGEIVTKIIGKELQRMEASAAPAPTGGPVLITTGLAGNRLRDVDFSIAEGEIVGIGGLVGCGRSELMRILGGAQRPRCGEMTLRGRAYRPGSPSDAIARGVASSPQERRREGIVLQMSVAENLTLGRLGGLSRAGAISHKKEASTVEALVSAFSVKTAGAGQTIALLSGGNQQKVMLGRTAGFGSELLLLDEPTQGVDAHAKAEIAQLIREQASRSVPVVVASTDFEDFVGLAHRVVILDRGRVVGTAAGDDVTVENLSLICATASSASHDRSEP